MERTLERMGQLVWMLAVTGWMCFHLASAQETDGECVCMRCEHIYVPCIYKVFADRTVNTANCTMSCDCISWTVFVKQHISRPAFVETARASGEKNYCSWKDLVGVALKLSTCCSQYSISYETTMKCFFVYT